MLRTIQTQDMPSIAPHFPAVTPFKSPPLSMAVGAVRTLMFATLVATGCAENPYSIDCSDPDNAPRCDFDEDLFTGAEECNDFDDSINPDAEEIPYDDIDQNCDGKDLTDVDGDGFDGSAIDGPDCDDDNPNVNPAQAETCGPDDLNCDGEPYLDAIDAKGFGPDFDFDGFAVQFRTWDCAESIEPIWIPELSISIPMVGLDGDCDDADNDVYPGAPDPEGTGKGDYCEQDY